VRKKDTQRIYALKTIRKAHIAQRPGEITHILAERTVLALVNNPFIVPLKFSFQNPDKLYLVMSFGERFLGFGLVESNWPRQSMVESYFITYNARASLIRTEADSTLQSFCVPWNICMVSMWYTGKCMVRCLFLRSY
jgi:serine/threonine protein kinase